MAVGTAAVSPGAGENSAPSSETRSIDRDDSQQSARLDDSN